jgi:hypothetical protein
MCLPFLARTGLATPIWPCPFVGADRKSATDRRNDAIDPSETLALVAAWPFML